MRTSITHKEDQTFTFPMTDPDVLTRVDEVNELISQETSLSAKKQLIQKEINTLKADANHKLQCIARREEPREVECMVVFDYEGRTVETTYEGEIMNSRKLSEWEFSSRPVDIYPEIDKTKVEGVTLGEAVDRAGEIAEKVSNIVSPSANVNVGSEAKTETMAEGLNT